MNVEFCKVESGIKRFEKMIRIKYADQRGIGYYINIHQNFCIRLLVE